MLCPHDSSPRRTTGPKLRVKKSPALLLLLIVLGWFHGSAARAQLLREATPAGLQPLPGSKAWRADSTVDLEFALPYRSRVKPDTLLIGLGHPNATRFLALFPDVGVNLPLKFAKEFHGFNEFGDLRPGYSVEVAVHRFDPAGEPELVIAVGDGRTELAVNVVKYHAPASRKEAAKEDNWVVEGSFSGQAQARIKGDTLELPADAPKPGKTYTWAQGKFTGG